MTVALQIRDVPEEYRDVLAAEAAEHGQSMQAYLLDLVAREVRVVQNANAFDRLAPHRIRIPPELDVVAIIREGRDGGFEIDRDDYQ
jgi:plasmid stability protein